MSNEGCESKKGEKKKGAHPGVPLVFERVQRGVPVESREPSADEGKKVVGDELVSMEQLDGRRERQETRSSPGV